MGFWQRMQAIEAAVHRWDADRALGAARPLAADLAADSIGLTARLDVRGDRSLLDRYFVLVPPL